MDDNLEGLIDDNPDLDNESEGEDGEKRKHEDSELEEDLSDDDYALIEENLGIKVKRKVSYFTDGLVAVSWYRDNYCKGPDLLPIERKPW